MGLTRKAYNASGMSKPFSFSEVEIDVETGTAASGEAPEPDEPFRIVILGDFSGRANRGLCERRLAGRRPILVDRDNFDQVLGKLGAELHLPVSAEDGPRLAIRFRELDDFHPDRIFERVDLFQALRRSRSELLDPATFAKAAAGLRPPSPPPVSHERAARRLSLDDLLEETIQETESRASEGRASRVIRDDWSALLHEIVAPHLVPGAPPHQKELLAELDAATSHQMCALLHHPDFQALEAAWRGLFFLVRRLETGPQLKLYVLDVSKAELAASPDPEIYRLLVEQTVGTPGAERWTVLAGNYTFDGTAEDLELLGRLARTARAAGAPFLAAASPHLVGCETLAETPDPDDWQRPLESEVREAWEALRRRPEADYLGLALPRFLLRLPYGKDTDSTEQFDFEELPASPAHQAFLWGNPAFACVYLLGQAFSEEGWQMRPGAVTEIPGLPACVYKEDGEARLKPCAEVLLTERAAWRILDEGLMPLVSLEGADAVRLFRFQSLASPAAALAGRWA